jgi:hypothetical protein
MSVTLTFDTDAGARPVTLCSLIVAGWTGRDAGAVQHHIHELAALGVPAPSTVPLYYRASASLLTQEGHVQVLGTQTSGEAEPLLIRDDAGVWLGLGSDHTDRGLEAVSVAASKQICAKPVARELWRYDSVSGRLDALELASFIRHDPSAEWEPYQRGTLAAIRPLADLMAGAGGLEPGTAMLCGTLSAIGGVRPAPYFRMTLRDPATGREIAQDYAVQSLPVVA